MVSEISILDYFLINIHVGQIKRYYANILNACLSVYLLWPMDR